jgi:protein-disulfide isomerase
MSSRKAKDTILSLPVDESRDHIQGSVTVPVTLVEYGDYECPYYAQA